MKKKQIIQIIRNAADLQADGWIVHDDKLVVSFNRWFLSFFGGGGSNWNKSIFSGFFYVRPLFVAADLGSTYNAEIPARRKSWSLEEQSVDEVAAELHGELTFIWDEFQGISTVEGFTSNALKFMTRKKPLRHDPFWPLERDLACAHIVLGHADKALFHLRRAHEGLELSAAVKATLFPEEHFPFIQRLTAAVEAGDGSALAMLEAIREDNVQRLGIAEICH